MDYYTKELAKLSEDGINFKLTSGKAQTNWMQLNPESKKALITWLNNN